MRPGDHLHLHLPDFDVGGTEQWALAMGAALSDLPCRRTVTAGVRLDAAAVAAFHGWRAIAIDDIPQQALIVAPCNIERLVSRSRRVIAVAHGMNDYYKQLFSAGGYFKAVAVSQIAKRAFPTGADVTVLHNGIDLERLNQQISRDEVRRSLGFAPDAVVVGHVGRTSIGKQPLLAAMAAGGVANGAALYVGPAPAAALRTEARALADCRFLTTGAEHSIADCYAAMDVCLVASRSEGFSLVTAEAWASLTPVVSTPVGISLEHPDLVIRIPQDPSLQNLAGAVRSALDSGRRPTLERAREIVHKRYTLLAMGRRWRHFLENLEG